MHRGRGTAPRNSRVPERGRDVSPILPQEGSSSVTSVASGMNSPPPLCSPNVPALVSHQPTLPRDEPSARGRRTCPTSRVPDQRLAPQARPPGARCGEAKPAPWWVAGRRLRGAGTDLSCLKRTRSGLSLGSPVVGLLTDRTWGTISRAVLGGMWALDVGAAGRSCLFVIPRSPRAALHHAPDRESPSACKSWFRQGSWLTATTGPLTAHHGRRESLTFRREGLHVPRNPPLQQPRKAHARVCNGNTPAASYGPQSHVHEIGTKRQIRVLLLLLFRPTSTSQPTCFCVVGLTAR